MTDPLRISVVIPTRNRPESLTRLLRSIEKQTRHPDEIIVVDASDNPGMQTPPAPDIRVLRSTPSVCRQRNIGIASAAGNHVLLCDDDIELPFNYLEVIEHYISDHPDAGAVCGFLQEEVGGNKLHWTGLLWRFCFQLSVWIDVKSIPLPSLLNFVVGFYGRKGNTFSLGGWPLLTDTSSDVFRTAVYGLGGGALVRKEWLQQSPYDEILGPNGIGDNYGVAAGFPGSTPIHVVKKLTVNHHRSEVNRLAVPKAYIERVIALHYFLTINPRFSRANRAWLIWSLVGNAIAQIVTGRWRIALASIRALVILPLGLNPLIRTRSTT